MNIGEIARNKYTAPAVKTGQGPAKSPQTGQTASPQAPAGDSFQLSRSEAPTLMQKVGGTLKTYSPVALGKSALKAAAYVVGDLIPGAVGAGVSVAKDTLFGGTRQSHFEHKVQTGSETEASRTFQESKERLLNPNEWKKLGPKWGAASFQVYSQETKKPIDGPPKNGDYLKIGLPDPFPHVWVQIDSIAADDKQAEVVVRPSVDPTSNSNDIAHFFSDSTANVFRVRQEGNEVISSVTGVDEKLNTKSGIMNKAISAARLGGAWLGAKKPQWSAFARKMVEGPAPKRGLQTSGLETALNVSSDAFSAGKDAK